MAPSYDRIFRGGTVVNHDGRGLRDIGVTDGRIAAIGDLSAAAAGEAIDCTRPAHPARRHRQPGAFPRAGRSSTRRIWRPGSRAAVLGGVTAVFEMPNTNPLTTTRRGAGRQGARAPRDRMHCDFAFWVGGTRENAGDVAELERLPGAAGIKVFMGSSTGDLLVEDDEGVRLDPAAARAAAPPSIPRTSTALRERARPARRGRSVARIRSGATTRRRCAARERLVRIARETRRAHPRAAHLDRRGDGASSPTTRTSRPSRRRRIT